MPSSKCLTALSAAGLGLVAAGAASALDSCSGSCFATARIQRAGAKFGGRSKRRMAKPARRPRCLAVEPHRAGAAGYPQHGCVQPRQGSRPGPLMLRAEERTYGFDASASIAMVQCGHELRTARSLRVSVAVCPAARSGRRSTTLRSSGRQVPRSRPAPAGSPSATARTRPGCRARAASVPARQIPRRSQCGRNGPGRPSCLVHRSSPATD